jgi:hypothetical protein
MDQVTLAWNAGNARDVPNHTLISTKLFASGLQVILKKNCSYFHENNQVNDVSETFAV